MDKASALRQYFGHSSFRPGQERLVDGILSGRDALGIMPTGGGKSLCYQVPALLLPGLTLVVSPLISLMKDQVAALTAAGVPAAFFNSSQTLEEYQEVFRGIRSRAYRLVYVAPERLENPRFAQLMAQQDVSLLAVDEAHCISQWGQDFRPSYLKIADFSANLCRRPIMAAFTATATARVQEDIVTQLALQRPVRVVTGFDRPNLFFDVQRPRHKLSALLSLIAQRPGKSGIVYCATRSAVERVWTALNEHGISAARYHAGLPEEERRANQDDFQFDRRAVMVATNAFGMGIDKSNVSFVIHYNMPKNLEAYYQEAGRAGRDGEAADCILLYSPGDVTTARYLIDHSADGSELTQEAHHALRRMEQDRLAVMTDYCKTDRCLRGAILDHFGQDHADSCGNCGNCQGIFEEADITVPAQMILSCVKRVRDRLGYHVGASLVSQVLRGSKNRRVLELGLDQLPTYGLMRDTSQEQLRAYLDCLSSQGLVFTDPEHATLRLGPGAGGVLFRGERVTMNAKVRPAQVKPAKNAPEPVAAPAAPADSELLSALKAERARLARRDGVPAYIVFSNATLADMAAKAPDSLEALLQVSGVGEVKAARYGEEFLAVIAARC